MIYSYLKLGRYGALGNQLWQIASTIGIADVNNGDIVFPHWAYGKYFRVPKEFFGDTTEIDVDLGENGEYLQDYHYFLHCHNLIREYFEPSEMVENYLQETYQDILGLDRKIAVHVRRGDYLRLPQYHPVCNADYFARALEIIGPGQVVVFSDDLDWCRTQPVFKDAIFADGNPPGTGEDQSPRPSVVIDLFLMAKMDAHVISNSTFSWWGAWLAGSPLVITPKPWYGPALQHIDVPGTMILPDWIELERTI